MKAAVVHGPGDVRWQSIADPDIPAGWVRVDIKAVGVCSSDVPRALHGAAYHYPIVLGHEMAGVVAEVADEVGREWVGRRVAVAPMIPCRRCPNCERGRYSLCDSYDYMGSRRDGGCAQALAAPVANLVPLPDSLDMASAALLEPAAVALHALRARVEAGDAVLVVGAGPIGLFLVQLARILGAADVIAVDPAANRLELASALGAGVLQGEAGRSLAIELEDRLDGRRADLVAVATEAPSAQSGALALARKGGRVVYLGLPSGTVSVSTEDFESVVRGELELSGSWNSYSAPFPGAEWQAVRAHMASGRLKAAPLISRRMPLAEAEAAYRLLDSAPTSEVKVLLTP